ncbi:MAG: SDR family oxidoreductase [Saprospiraceae bacterium]|nr:SDR family oxidoreductase [Saprospiraceae bacterium]
MKKTIVITGATSGLGLASAKSLANQTDHLILLATDLNKAEEAKQEVISAGARAQVECYAADLGNQKEIREVARKIRHDYPVIDVLINNAGVWYSERMLTEDGIEEVFAVNHLAYFLLTHLLYPSMALSEDGRIINVGSDSHFKGQMHFDDLSLESHYHGLRSYAQSKLANLLFTYELDRRKPGPNVVVNCVQPGLVQTDIGLKHTRWLHRVAWKFRRRSGVTPDEGARTQVYLATSPEVKGVSGKYWDNRSPKSSSGRSYDEAAASQLWEISKELCGVSDFFKPAL